MTAQPIRIGTRDSKLAVWQAEYVQNRLSAEGYNSELVFIKTEGDRQQDLPIHQIGGQGVFTKALDDALLENRIDLAVHSCKDLPTLMPEGITLAAIPVREDPRDVLVANGDTSFLEDPNSKATIATSSNRRKGQWLSHYPHHTITEVRGNVQTRLRKLEENGWQGIIFAAAGLKRLGMEDIISESLDWMLAAPAQGALAVACRHDDPDMRNVCSEINDERIAAGVTAERTFLRILEGGCSAPIGAHALIEGETITLRGRLDSLDGQKTIRAEAYGSIHSPKRVGEEAARQARTQGGAALVAMVRQQLS